jgi:hypothetical protein
MGFVFSEEFRDKAANSEEGAIGAALMRRSPLSALGWLVWSIAGFACVSVIVLAAVAF